MPTPLVECIPNFSEARRQEVVAAIVAAITGVTEVSLLNHSSDKNHRYEVSQRRFQRNKEWRMK
jgi:glutamate formiminotransferase